MGRKKIYASGKDRVRAFRARQRAEAAHRLDAPTPPVVAVVDHADPVGALAEWSLKKLIVPPRHPRSGSPLELMPFAVDWLRETWNAHESAISKARKNSKSAIAEAGAERVTVLKITEAQAAYQKRRAAGVCASCVKRAAPGRVHCRSCGVALRKLTPARRLEQTRLAAGLCPRCTGPLALGRLSCAGCLADKRAASRECKAKWGASGLCLKCGHVREDPALRQCAHCRAQGHVYKEQYRADGLCHYGRFCVPGRKSCETCLRIHREYQRRRRAAVSRSRTQKRSTDLADLADLAGDSAI